MGKVVGIDLGTTNSVVAVMEGGKPVVIANAEGMRTTPSVIGMTKEGERVVGQMARRQAISDPQNTFFGIKRYMGRRYSELTPEAKRVPYTLRKDEDGNVRIKCPRLTRDFAPEELSAMILKKLVDEASRYLGEPVREAVITVPAYFNDSQRQATRDAGRIAGLEVKRILNEPTAASLAYGLDRQIAQTILVFDLGGGTFDVSVLEVGDGVFEVKATSGDTQLGGNDFDKRIVDWLAEQFLEAEGVDLRNDRQSLQRLSEAAEKAKIELSGVTVTEINLPFITATEDGPKHLETRLTRSQFEGLCSDLVSRLRGPVKQVVRDAGIFPNQIDEVVLVGGSTRIPLVQEIVRSMIGREPNQNVNPDEVVAIGAAIQAGILAGEMKDILLLDVTPLSIGLETIGGVMKKLIPRNTTIPVRRSDIFSTGEDNQTLVEVHVLQGEREMAAGNKSLGRFKLTGIPPAPRGIPQIQVSFDIDANGILQVAAMDRTTGREQSITIQGASTLAEEEVQRLIREAEEYAEQDRQKKARVEKRNRAEALTFQAERQLREATLDFGMQFVSPYRSRIEAAIQALRSALSESNDRAIDRAQTDLQDSLYELNREVYQRNKEEEEEGSLLNAIKSFFLDDDEEDWDDRREYGSPYRDDPRPAARDYGYPGGRSRQEYGYSNERRSDWRDYDNGDSWDQPRSDRRSEQRDYGPGGSSWGRSRSDSRESYDRDKSGRESSGRENYGRDNYGQDNYGRENYGRDNYEQSRSSRDSRGRYEPDPPRLQGYGRDNPPQESYNREGYDRSSYDPDRPRQARGRDSSGDRRWDERTSYSPRSPKNQADREQTNRPPSRPSREPRPNLYQDNWDDEDDWL